jgi:hypothetical protein
MIFFYSFAMLPILLGLLLWWKNKSIVWWEWLAGCGIALLLAGLFHFIAIQAQCRDHEIFSGQIVEATHHPYWGDKVRVEDYRTETYTTGSGKDRQTHTRRVHTGHHYEYHDHPEHWTCEAYYGSYGGTSTYKIDRLFFDELAVNLCNKKLRTITPYKPNFYKGDRNDYVADNKTGYVYPTTKKMSFKNRVKASPSLYSYAPVPKDAKVFPYPECPDYRKSNRLLGTASKDIAIRDFDRLCSALGPFKKVNLILIGFGNMDSEIAHLQEASWIGGKKNDLVMCYGGTDPKQPSWTYVFGWTDREIVKANLQTILLDNPINKDILPLIKSEVIKNYEIKEWRDFNYLQVDPPRWSYWVYILVTCLCQVGLYFWAGNNDFYSW